MRRIAFVWIALAVFAALTNFVPPRASALTADFSTVAPAGRMTVSAFTVNQQGCRGRDEHVSDDQNDRAR
jgi:hypothetical protein